MNGRFKETPEDFEVEELPAYLPSGEGEHLFLWVEKRGVSTPDAARRLARHVGADEREFSWAGLKDRQALTRQFLSVSARAAAKGFADFTDPQVKVVRAALHRNKLKNGHLKGNRFTVRLRGVEAPSMLRARFAEVCQNGVPNFFGEQRFGAAKENAALGKQMLLEPRRQGRKSFERKLMLSAYQSLLFNRALDQRVAAGTLHRALKGDVLKKHETGGEFVCAEPDVDQPRVECFEVSATGPLFGPQMRRAEGEVGAAEEKLLQDDGVSFSTFDAGGRETQGARRLFRVRLGEPTLELTGDDALLRFELPPGSYATVVLTALGAEPA